MMAKNLLKVVTLITTVLISGLQTSRAQVWMPDLGNGTYKNPVLNADYSDPDVIRTGDDYYLVASSFTCQPGIPVLHSKDLVNWTIINYVYITLPFDRYKQVQHGQGSWAPAIRYHNSKYYVYVCTPEEGLLMAETTDPAKKWEMHVVKNVRGWEDPCPFWDEDGQAYLLHGKKGAGPAILHKMSADGRALLDTGVLIYQNRQRQPVLEGFKFMEKRNGYYYFAAPAGGVSTGWQSVFRSKNIYGPYEDQIVMNQGKTQINGPHQGGYVETQTGEWWFMHFQAKGAYGRIVHLQPVHWENGWPVTGQDDDHDGTGQPVMTYRKPNVGKTYPAAAPQTTDEFDSDKLGLQWQWQAAPDDKWYTLLPKQGKIRLNAASHPVGNGNLFYAGNLLLQKLTAPAFTVTASMQFKPGETGERAGLVMMGSYFTCLCLEKREAGIALVLYEGKKQTGTMPMTELYSGPVDAAQVWLRGIIKDDATCQYAYSTNGKDFKTVGAACKLEKGDWIGAKTGVFCITPNADAQKKGYADFDYFRVTANK